MDEPKLRIIAQLQEFLNATQEAPGYCAFQVRGCISLCAARGNGVTKHLPDVLLQALRAFQCAFAYICRNAPSTSRWPDGRCKHVSQVGASVVVEPFINLARSAGAAIRVSLDEPVVSHLLEGFDQYRHLSLFGCAGVDSFS